MAGMEYICMDMKICVGLSGGVDSSVAALLLKRQGCDVFAMFMQNWHDADSTLHGDCEWEEDRFVAELVARKIGIPFYFVDLSKEYRARVVDYMFDEYARGRTPNPDVLCNREIKFDAFLKAAARLGADAVATGHYCRKEQAVRADGTTEWRLLEGIDPGKDQSYFLCQLTQEQLSKAIFPIGGLLKSEVRAIAAEADLPSADKKDSQGICFVGKVDLPTFLKQKLSPKEGEIVEVYPQYFENDALYAAQKALLSSLTADGTPARMISSYISEEKPDGEAEPNAYDPGKLSALSGGELAMLASPVRYDIRFETETYRSGKRHVKKTRYKDNPHGKVIGMHDGAQFYTIGQRKGLAVGGHKESLFVIGNDIGTNRVFVGEGHSHPGLSRSVLRIATDEIHQMRTGILPAPGKGLLRCRVRIRYRQPLQDATLLMRENGLFIVFDSPQRGITPGQFAAWYAAEADDPANAEYPELLGSGVISE